MNRLCALCGGPHDETYRWFGGGGDSLCRACVSALWETWQAMMPDELKMPSTVSSWGVGLEWHMIDRLLRSMQRDPERKGWTLTLFLPDSEHLAIEERWADRKAAIA